MSKIIELAHGSGGIYTQKLINECFYKHFKNDYLLRGDDSAHLDIKGGRIAYTTDSFVVTPIFFKGGDIGRLSIAGTVNDLITAGARPQFLSAGFIIEEGFPMEDLERIAESMALAAKEAGVNIVTGDTKVVQKSCADKVFINTSGIGIIDERHNISSRNAKPGDAVIITGTVGDHGASLIVERENLGLLSDLNSDCAPLWGLLHEFLDKIPKVHVMRDPTRGGVATALNEIAKASSVNIKLVENKIPVCDPVKGVCAILGMDALYMANEGKMLIILPQKFVETALEILKKHPYGRNAAVIGEVAEGEGRLYLETFTGSKRILDMMGADQYPRIC